MSRRVVLRIGGRIEVYAVALSHLYARLPFSFWVNAKFAALDTIEIPRLCACGCTCSVNGKPFGLIHREHSCCVLARAGFSR